MAAKKKITPKPKAKVQSAPVKVAQKSRPVVKKAPVKSGKPSRIAAPKGRVAAAAEPDEDVVIKSTLSAKELQNYRNLLLKLRDRIVDGISFLANDSLNRSQKHSTGDLSSHSFHMADQGTDNFDREFAANLLSSEQDSLYEIDEALRRIELGTYGICEVSGKPIEKERLKVIPFARYSVAVQSERERGKPRYRPFRRTSIQTTETLT